MKRFRFRLEAVRRVRDVRERQARAALARAMQQASENAKAIAAQRETSDSATERVDATLAESGCSAAELKRILALRTEAATRIDRLERMQLTLDERIRERRSEHAAARRELRVVEQLRERALAEWKIEAARAEVRDNGELFLTRVARRRAEGEMR